MRIYISKEEISYGSVSWPKRGKLKYLQSETYEEIEQIKLKESNLQIGNLKRKKIVLRRRLENLR